MAAREAKAAKSLPKTGIPTVDQEAIVVQACLARIEEHAARTGLGQTSLVKHNKGVTKVVGSPAGRTVDISARTEMGREPPAADSLMQHEELLPERTDSVVAQSALLRLMRMAANALNEHDDLVKRNKQLQQEMLSKNDRIITLEHEVNALRAEVESYTAPDAAFKLYKEAWKKQHTQCQTSLQHTNEEKSYLISQLLERKKEARKVKKMVFAKKALFNTTDAQLEEEFAGDEQMIQDVMSIFHPNPTNVSLEKQPTVALPEFELDTMLKANHAAPGISPRSNSTNASVTTRPASATTQASSRQHTRPTSAAVPRATVPRPASATPSNVAEASIHQPPPHTQSNISAGSGDGGGGALSSNTDTELMLESSASHQLHEEGTAQMMANLHSIDIDHVLDNVDDLLDGNGLSKSGGANGNNGENEEKKKAEESNKRKGTEELVITRYISSGERHIAIQDSSSTLIGTFMSVFAHAPSTYSALHINMDSTVGRREQLQRQARSFHIEPLWDEAQLYQNPTLLMVECRTPLPEEVSTPFHRADGKMEIVIPERNPWAQNPLTQDEDEELTDREIEERRVRMEKLLQFKRLGPGKHEARNYMLPQTKDDDVHEVCLKQHPGIISHIAHDFGEGKHYVSPIANNHVRCYASSMVKSASVENLIKPFVDLRDPYFCTENEPGQHVTIAFDNMYVIPTGYSIASVHPIQGGLYPRNWKLEGSDDGLNWTLLKHHKNDETLNRYHPTYFFDVDIPRTLTRRHFSHFRLVQDGPNAMNTHEFNVSSFEVYGRLMHVHEPVPKSGLLLPSRPIRKTGFKPFTELPEVKVPKKKGKAKGKKR